MLVGVSQCKMRYDPKPTRNPSDHRKDIYHVYHTYTQVFPHLGKSGPFAYRGGDLMTRDEYIRSLGDTLQGTDGEYGSEYAKWYLGKMLTTRHDVAELKDLRLSDISQLMRAAGIERNTAVSSLSKVEALFTVYGHLALDRLVRVASTVLYECREMVTSGDLTAEDILIALETRNGEVFQQVQAFSTAKRSKPASQQEPGTSACPTCRSLKAELAHTQETLAKTRRDLKTEQLRATVGKEVWDMLADANTTSLSLKALLQELIATGIIEGIL